MADYSQYPLELKERMNLLKETTQRMMQEIASDFSDIADIGTVMHLYEADMGYNTVLARKRKSNHYYQYLSEKSSDCK